MQREWQTGRVAGHKLTWASRCRERWLPGTARRQTRRHASSMSTGSATCRDAVLLRLGREAAPDCRFGPAEESTRRGRRAPHRWWAGWTPWFNQEPIEIVRLGERFYRNYSPSVGSPQVVPSLLEEVSPISGGSGASFGGHFAKGRRVGLCPHPDTTSPGHPSCPGGTSDPARSRWLNLTAWGLLKGSKHAAWSRSVASISPRAREMAVIKSLPRVQHSPAHY